MPEILLVLTVVLFAITIGAAAEYLREVQKIRKEYKKAKGAVEDIILSYNRQLRHEAQRLETVAFKVEALTSRTDHTSTKVEDATKRLAALEARMISDSSEKEQGLTRLNEIEKSVRITVASQESTSAKITSLEEQLRRLPTTHEVNLEAVIPIKREKAMSQLTLTEIAVLEMLASEGSKTAPEIKERVKLSREHTARLMKKLYEEGYLERETNKIPFKYSVKKEMEKLLKKPESTPA